MSKNAEIKAVPEGHAALVQNTLRSVVAFFATTERAATVAEIATVRVAGQGAGP